MTTFVIDISDGEVIKQIEAAIEARGVRRAGMSLVGGVDSFTISTMPRHDATQDNITTYQIPGELTGTGEVVDGRVHVHAVCGVEGDEAMAGHLHSAYVETHFVRAYVTEVD